jgi:hypothetical protein
MTSQAAFDSLRMAATLALAVPSLAVRITAPMHPCIEVSWFPRPSPAGVRQLPPCLFRRCVGCAHHRRQAGEPVTFLGLPDGMDPQVELLVAPGDRRLPSGIYQVRVKDGWRVVVPCLVPPPRAAELLAGEWPDLGLHPDPLTGVTLVTQHRSADQGPVAGEAADRIVAAQARLLVDELLAEAPRS